MKMTNHILKKTQTQNKNHNKTKTLKCVKARKEAAAYPALTPLTVTMSQRTVVDCSSLPFFLLSSVTHFIALLKNPIGESFKVRPWCGLEPVFYSGVGKKFFHFSLLFLVLIWLDSLLHFDLQWVFPMWKCHIQKLKDCKNQSFYILDFTACLTMQGPSCPRCKEQMPTENPLWKSSSRNTLF